MLSYSTYKLLHVASILLLLSGIASVWALRAAADSAGYPALKKMMMVIHGVAMFLVLLGGFGTMARLDIAMPWPAWIWLKLVIWITLGALPAFLNKGSKVSKGLFFVAPLLAAIAAWAAINHVGG